MREIPMQMGGTTGAKELQDGYDTAEDNGRAVV